LKLADLHYDLPESLIAQHPADRRDASRLLVLDRANGRRSHDRFAALPDLLPGGSLLVLNNTRVLPARLMMRRATGGAVQGLFLRETGPGEWEVMLTGSGRLKAGELLGIEGSDRRLKLRQRVDAGTWRVEPVPAGEAHAILGEVGLPPLPPYIRRKRQAEGECGSPATASKLRAVGGTGSDREQAGRATQRQMTDDFERYQTIYARHPGAVAAPTAGLHFTPELFERLAGRGIEKAFVTLHVGVGTFAPIRCNDLANHEMHAEWYDCPAETAAVINAAREAGRPIVAVGTTSVRVLESCTDERGQVATGSGWTRIFIYPPYRFRAVDHLITNFHLPGSTLLAMIFAFAGRERVLAAYNDAIEQRYRFYSYGDAMLIL